MSSRYFGGIVNSTPPTLNPAAGNAANGVFTMSQYMQAVRAATWPGFDPYFKQTTLLLHGNGTNGAQNNTFLDSSTNNFTITRNGNTTQGTFSPFSLPPGQWSNFFDGTGDYLSIADNAAFDLGSGDFTIEAWVYPTSFPTGGTILSQWPGGSNLAYIFQYTSTGRPYFAYQSGSSVGITGTTTAVVLNTWNHIAVTRSSTTIRLFVNGVQDATTGNIGTATIANSTAEIRVGFLNATDGNAFVNGYLSNVRLVKGTAVYTSNFTPSTAPLTDITNTSLLTCQSNRFVDNSTNNFTITRNGDVRVTPYSPFGPVPAYSAGTNGGSGYFDGSGDFLSIADNAAFELSNSNFAIEAWVYPLALPSSGSISNIASQYITTGSRSFLFALYNNSGTMQLLFQPVSGSTDTPISQNFAFKVGEWAHVAAVRSGNNITLYGNGVSLGTTAYSSTINNATGPYLVGCRYNASSVAELLFTGYIAGHRLIVGSDTAPSGIPTAPPTAVTNTQLLLNFTNAGIFDQTGKNVLETVGNAQVETAIKKFGDGAMEFDGTGDYAVQPTSDSYGYGTGDFTIEFWLYLKTVNNQTIVSNLAASNSTNPHIYINTTIRYYTANADRITGPALNTNQWYHIAVCRASGLTRLFVDGTQRGATYTDANNYGITAPLGIGTYWSAGAPFTTSTLNGIVDELRITKGVARYLGNFGVPAVPTGPFPLVGGPYAVNDTLLLPGTGTNGAQNNTFLDSSTNNFTITRNGNTTQGTFTPFSRPANTWAVAFDGVGDVITTPKTSDLVPAGDFTIECWVYPMTWAMPQIAGLHESGTNADWILGLSATGQVAMYIPTSNISTSYLSTVTLPANQWSHVVATRTGNTLYLGCNGSLTAHVGITGSLNYGTSNPFSLGADQNGDESNVYGYISNFRMVSGTGLYSGTTYTVPTAPLTNITNTVLLTCQSTRFVDNSSIGRTLTRGGDARITPFSPFEYPSAYSPATNGGSGYFDGTGDFLTAASNTAFDLGSSNFTIEAWVNPDVIKTSNVGFPIISRYASGPPSTGWLLRIVSTTTLRFVRGDDVVLDATGLSIPTNAWSHVVVSRSSGNLSIFLNGSRVANATGISNFTDASATCQIGRTHTLTDDAQGYISNVRVVKGTAVYDPTQTTLTVPTAPLTAITNTSLLLNFTNAGIIDATMGNVFETVGNAQISTTQSKWGGGSMYFDGNGDYLVAPRTLETIFGNGDFTIECWVYLAALPASGSAYAICGRWGASAGNLSYLATIPNVSGVMSLRLEISTTGSAVAATYTVTAPISASRWHHVSYVRDGGSLRIFLDGVELTSAATITGTLFNSTANLIIGSNSGTTAYFNGYISDLRILKGVALLPSALQTSQWQDQ